MGSFFYICLCLENNVKRILTDVIFEFAVITTTLMEDLKYDQRRNWHADNYWYCAAHTWNRTNHGRRKFKMRSPNGLFVFIYREKFIFFNGNLIWKEDESWLLRFSELPGAYLGWLCGRQRHQPHLPHLWYATLFTGCAKTSCCTSLRKFGMLLRGV